VGNKRAKGSLPIYGGNYLGVFPLFTGFSLIPTSFLSEPEGNISRYDFCLGFALYFWILGTAFRNWTDIFLKPTTHLLLSATSLRNFSAFLKEPLGKAISEKEDLLPSEALRRIRNFMLKLLMLQALGIVLLILRNPTPPLAEEWVGAIAHCLSSGRGHRIFLPRNRHIDVPEKAQSLPQYPERNEMMLN